VATLCTYPVIKRPCYDNLMVLYTEGRSSKRARSWCFCAGRRGPPNDITQGRVFLKVPRVREPPTDLNMEPEIQVFYAAGIYRGSRINANRPQTFLRQKFAAKTLGDNDFALITIGIACRAPDRALARSQQLGDAPPFFPRNPGGQR